MPVIIKKYIFQKIDLRILTSVIIGGGSILVTIIKNSSKAKLNCI